MDNLDIDVIRANTAGIPYGEFKSLHPQTKEENKRYTVKEGTLIRKPDPVGHVCLICGKTFAPRNVCQVYCSKACSEEARREYQKNWYRRKRDGKDTE